MVVPRWLQVRLATTLAAWFAAFLVVMAVLLPFGDNLQSLPLAARALVLSGLMVAFMANLLMPVLNRAVARWLASAASTPLRVRSDSEPQSGGE